MKKLKTHILFSLFVVLSSCKTEIKNLSCSQDNFDSCNIDLDYIRNGKKVTPLREIITVKVPSANYVSRKNKRAHVILPDKEIGSNVPIKIKVCGEYKKGKYVCDSIIRYSSKKSLKIQPDINFSNKNNPKIYISTSLYRNRYDNIGEELAAYSVDTQGTLNIQYEGKGYIGTLPIKNGYNYSSVWSSISGLNSNKLSFTTVKNDIKKAFNKKGELDVSYDVKMDWKGESFYSKSSQNLKAVIHEIKESYYHWGKLKQYDSKFYKYYNYGQTLGAITFKEETKSSGLKVEVYADSNFSEIVSNSLESNVLFDEYPSQYLYIKVVNNGLVFGDGHKFIIGAHSVDYKSIIRKKSSERAFYGLLAWLTDSETNDVARTFEIGSIILGNGNLEDGVTNFLGNEFKRQISNSLGGNFATDVGVEATAEIGKNVYRIYNRVDIKDLNYDF